MCDLSDRIGALDHTPTDMRLAELAARQENAVALEQLYGLGLTKRQVHHRSQCGRLHRIYRGVYAVGQPKLTPRGRLWAAHLRCGPDSCISHWPAAWVLRLAYNRGRVQVTSPRQLRITEFTTHRGTPSTTVVDGLPVTTWARTIIDIAATSTDRTVERLLNEAVHVEIFDLTELGQEMESNRGHRGTARTNRALSSLQLQPSRTESNLEESFLRLIDEIGLPRPHAQVPIGPYRADFLWPDLNLAVELDGPAHLTPERAESDRIRDAAFLTAGIATLRITERRITTERASLTRDLLALTGRRAA